ncbi:hypothetical protein [Shewanella sp. NIFS-20-20]|uniref:hypothetical protein n=1 Tax=Shewanella sp. NIFS-20-20 TaxID=2853806 RepID=UPI001C464434|nr:hypothetical protein [Shewanella sp. NIFS-20-20]MBV7316026.1 hypothetical protein [Shewanella sp. NIFS-20-20]
MKTPIALVLIGSCVAGNAMAGEINLSTEWDSKYISEGRNQLAKGGVFWGTAAYSGENFGSYISVGRADSVNYTEMDIGVEYYLPSFYDINTTLTYQKVEGYGDDRYTDNDFIVNMEYNDYEWLMPSVNYQYSTVSKGGYLELGLTSGFHPSEATYLYASAVQGFNYGYVNHDHKGSDNTTLTLGAQFTVQPNLTVSVTANQVFAGHAMDRETQVTGNPEANQDQTWAGVNLSWAM